MAQITPQMLRSLPGGQNHCLDAQITPQTVRLQVLLVHFDSSNHSPDAQIAPWTIKSLPGRSNHPPDPQITSLAMLCLFISMAQITPRCSDRSLDAQITPWTLKSLPRPSDYKSCLLACLFISMAQITTQMLRSLPGRSNHSLDAQITPQTLRLQVLLCLLVHCDTTNEMQSSIINHSNHASIMSRNHTRAKRHAAESKGNALHGNALHENHERNTQEEKPKCKHQSQGQIAISACRHAKQLLTDTPVAAKQSCAPLAAR